MIIKRIGNFIYYLLKKLYYSFSFLFLLLLFIIQKFIFVRIGYLHRNRIGHLVGNTLIYLYKKKLIKKFYYNNSFFQIDVWIAQKKIIYPIIERLFNKKLIILPQYILLGVYNLASKFSYFKKFIIDEHDWGMDYFNLNYKSKVENLLNKKQIIFAENKLKEISIYPNDKIACIINRNNFFNKNIIKDEKPIKLNNYRNSNFNDYLLAAKYLSKKGYKVIRMGSHDQNFKNKYVINYSSSRISDQLIDFFLLKKAQIIVSSGTGIDSIAAMLYKKKICYVNHSPYINIQSIKFTPGCVFIMKKLLKNNKLLSLKEIIQDNYFTIQDSITFKENGIKIINNSKKEIFECVKEFYSLNFEHYKLSKKKLILQKKFYKILNNVISLKKNYNLKLENYEKLKIAQKQKPLAYFSSYFLTKNPWFLKN